jgi:hypothetical protein
VCVCVGGGGEIAGPTPLPSDAILLPAHRRHPPIPSGHTFGAHWWPSLDGNMEPSHVHTAIRRQPSPPTPATSSAIQPSPHESHKSHSACHVSSWQDVSARRCCRAAPAQICRPNATRSSTAFLAAIAARLWRRTLIVRACLPPAAAARAVMLSKATGRIRRFGAGNPLHRRIPAKWGGWGSKLLAGDAFVRRAPQRPFLPPPPFFLPLTTALIPPPLIPETCAFLDRPLSGYGIPVLFSSVG